ncbi:MAG: zinc-ribbon domain-containing protein [Clostridia bacterium]|nr:zinc-ribbon domain-containing protein [Clostridia bacterium]
MKYCEKCGAGVQDGMGFCPVCGHPVGGQNAAQPQANQYGYYTQAAPANTDSSTASMICGILSFFFFGLVLSIVALVLASKDKKANGGVYSSHGKVGFITGLISLILQGVGLLIGIIAVLFFMPVVFSILSEGFGVDYGIYGNTLSAIIGMLL